MIDPVSVLQVDADWVQARRLCINMVLGTDMKKHFDIVSRFQASSRLASFSDLAHMVTQHVHVAVLLQNGNRSQILC